ncbi:S9 family peptidase [Clostridium sp. KNHs214]|uniref:alpha/beta hydrolase family protein n=1 Tax=Clostridium sp. KNHs214 TaxID=1540257 RepID=UPI00055782F6|nr:S9 family peptidase [Clostridium sp. KNHs214]
MDKNKYMTIEDVVSLPWMESVSISEDGMYASYVKRTTDWEDNAYRNHIWVYEKERNIHYPITTGKNESNNPLWSSKNNYLAYTAEVGEKDEKRTQIFLKSFDDLNGIQITNSKEGIKSFRWSPDGKGIFYTATEEDSKELKRRKEIYGDFEYIDKEYKNHSLYYIEIDKVLKEMKESRNAPTNIAENHKEDKAKDYAVQLTNPKEFHISGFNISPDGKKIIFVATPTSSIIDDNTDLCILDIKTRSVTKLKVTAKLDSSVSFSPDGKKVAYLRAPRDKKYYETNVEENYVLEIYDLDKNKIINRFKEFDAGIMKFKWTSKGIFTLWQDRTRILSGFILENGKTKLLCDDAICVIWDAAITSDGENIAYIKIAENETCEFYLNERKITSDSKAYENKLLSRKDLVTWETKDGLEIEGVLSLPQDFDDKKKYPLLVVIHGGPTWASFPVHNMIRNYPIEQFIEKGFIVLEPNYRGSSGYGSKFITANHRMLGLGDYEDVISGVDMLIEKGIADRERVGVMGWSQGGYISAFCSTYSNRFKAISVGAGISNWITYYVNTDITTFTREYLGNNPWKDKEIYEKTSPMTYITSACTPTLIQHGDKDGRVPTPNAFELYRGLKDMGVETELVIFKGMKHGPTKPGLHRAIMEQNLDWFVKHI